MLKNHFDRMKRGYIDKRFLANEVAKIPIMSETRTFYGEETVDRLESTAKKTAPVTLNVQSLQTKNPIVNK